MAKLANVLIIDDNPRCLEFMALAFSAHGGVNVASEMVPTKVLDRVRAEKPDLIVLDVKMPDIDGFEVLAMLRGEGNLVPVVMCSGSALQKDVDRAYAGGCNGYLEKPTTLEDYRAMAGAVVDYWRRGELPGH
jgi:two-component system, OmpR family, response regulator